MQLIPYKEEHKEQIISVWEKSVRATHNFLDINDIDYFKEKLKEIDFSTFLVYCLITENKLIGFIGVSGNSIETLFLDPDFIGKGYGRKMIQFAIKELNAYKVEVNEQNSDAVNFYTKSGFETYERTEKDGFGKDYPILKMKLKPEVDIRIAHKDEQTPYELLLLSDDTKAAINKNLQNGELFLAEINNKIIAAFILKINDEEVIEIKNIAVAEDWQGNGIGTLLLNFIKSNSKQRGFRKLLVGTCDLCQKEIAFYQKSGFIISDIRKNFFIDNYTEPIFENGIQLKDMIMLSIDLKKTDSTRVL